MTGSTPFERKRLNEAAFDEMLRIIREEEPPKPSTRLSSSDALPSIAANRSLEPSKLNRLVQGELDWIVMKALEKDRNRRYETANGFAADIERYLHDEPVEACPPSAAYRFRKFARRNRTALAIAAIVLSSLLIMTAGLGWVFRERTARQSVAEATANSALDEAMRLVKREKWPEALAAARRAEDALAGGFGGTPRTRIHDLRSDIEMALRLEEIRSGPETEKASDGSRLFDPETDRKNAQAFREYGIDIESLAPVAAAERIGRSRVWIELVTGLDSWASWRKTFIADDQRWKRLVEIASLADPDPWRNRLRKTLEMEGDARKAALTKLSASIDAENLPSQTICLFANLIRDLHAEDQAVGPLLAARRRHPDHFWINLHLGSCCLGIEPAQPDEAVRYLTAAQALRPESAAAHNNLGLALSAKAWPISSDEAIASYREAIRLKPDLWLAHYNLARCLSAKGLSDEAIASFNEAIRLQPDRPHLQVELSNLLQESTVMGELEI